MADAPLKAHGGRRANQTGRLSQYSVKERQDRHARQQARFDQACSEDLLEFYETAKQLANGLWYEEEDYQGGKRVYTLKPDTQMLKFLMENAIGKAAAKVQSVPDTDLRLQISHPRPKRGGQHASNAAEILSGGEDDEEGDAGPEDGDVAPGGVDGGESLVEE